MAGRVLSFSSVWGKVSMSKSLHVIDASGIQDLADFFGRLEKVAFNEFRVTGKAALNGRWTAGETINL